MTDEERAAFNKANEAWHPVEREWHYPILIKFGFKPLTETAQGFVREYEWVNDKGRKIVYHKGVNSDYWTDSETFWPSGSLKSFLWGELVPFLQRICV